MGWQPIETAPRKERRLILIWAPAYQAPMRAYSNTYWNAGFSAGWAPTHWMPWTKDDSKPLPDPPSGEQS